MDYNEDFQEPQRESLNDKPEKIDDSSTGQVEKEHSIGLHSRTPSRSRSPSRSPPRQGRSRSRSPPRRYRSRSNERHSSRRSRRRSLSLSRSRSRSASPPRRRRYSRSPPRRGRSRSRDAQRRREFHGTRERPETSPILGVFGLSLRTVKEDLEDIFGKYGPLQKVTIVSDHRQNQSRGFGFVYFENQEDATRARDATNGLMVDNRKIRVDYSMTHKPHTPTPGFYMGEPREDFRRGFRRRRSRSRSYRRSQPSYRSRSRSLSR